MSLAPAGRGRIEFGKRLRKQLSRADQGQLRSPDRKFDPMQVLLSSAAERVPALLPIKYSRMSVSPFAFFRGAVAVMAADLARLPHCGLHVQLCGDAHVQNLGSFAAPDGRLIFDFNDFDETIYGPWEWDLKRMATSIILAGRDADQPRPTRRAAVLEFAESYCNWMAEFASEPVLQLARHIVHRGEGGRPIHLALRQSERTKALDLLHKYVEVNGRGVWQFRNARPVWWRVTGHRAKEVRAAVRAYRACLGPERKRLFDRFRPVDVGFKVVGTGSVGLRDYVMLLEGNGPKDPLFLQIKQETKSAYAPYMPAQSAQQGQRVAEGQRMFQPASDPLLGWTGFGGHQYLVRQLNDHKGTIDLKTLEGGGLQSLGVVAGELLARGHARSGDACAISGYIGGGSKLVQAIADFAGAYADQVDADYSKFMAAIKAGKIKASEK